MDNENKYIKFSSEDMSFHIGEGQNPFFFWDIELYDANFDIEKSNGFGPSIVKINVHKGESFISGKCKIKCNGAFKGEEFVFLDGEPLELDKYEINFFDSSPRRQIIKILSPISVVKDFVNISFVFGEPGYDLDVSVDDECNIVVDSMSHKDYEIHFAVEFEKQKKTVRVYQKLEDLPSAPFVDNEQNITRVEFDDDESKKCIEMSVF